MNEPKTMREYLNRPVTADEAETEGRWDRIMIKQNDPILDAHIIRGTSADAPVWVIAPEAWEAFRAAWREWQKEPRQIDVEHAALVDILQALLPGARRAKEVGAAHGVLWANTSDVEELPYPSLVAVIADDGPRAAIHNEQEKE